MARCRLTRMSLHNIRKDKQYQCIVIDFVRTGVIAKSKAEELLGYTIPGGLLQGSVADPDSGSGSGSSGSGSSGSGSSGTGDSGNTGTGDSGSGNTDPTPTPVATIPVTIKVGTGYDDSGFILENEEYLPGNDGNNFVVEVPVNKSWNEAVEMIADTVDAYLAEKASADSSWSWAGYQIEGPDSPFYAIPDFQGSPDEWQYSRSPDDDKLYSSDTGSYTVPLSELDAETLTSLEQGFNMLLIVTASDSNWYHNVDWFSAL